MGWSSSHRGAQKTTWSWTLPRLRSWLWTLGDNTVSPFIDRNCVESLSLPISGCSHKWQPEPEHQRDCEHQGSTADRLLVSFYRSIESILTYYICMVFQLHDCRQEDAPDGRYHGPKDDQLPTALWKIYTALTVSEKQRIFSGTHLTSNIHSLSCCPCGRGFRTSKHELTY